VTIREYSRRLGKISDDQLRAALQRFGLGEFVCAEPISFGLFGQNLFLTSTQGEFILRGAPHYDWQFPTEQFFVEHLHSKTRVPVPYPYLFDPSTDIFGWWFVIMPRMPGLQMADARIAASLTQSDRRTIARALAEMLVEIQTLTWVYAGKYDIVTSTVQAFKTDYRDWIIKRIRQLLLEAQRCNNHTPQSDATWVESVLERVSHALHTPYQPCVVLEDYKEHNIVVERAANDWRVSGVFDLMTAHFGDGEADLARQVGTYLRENPALADVFVAAYLRNKTIQPGFAERQQLYMLYDSIIIWSFWQRQAGGLPEDKTLTFKQWAIPFVSYWENHGALQTPAQR
jgi:hygromycin-B 7''-O-kinase